VEQRCDRHPHARRVSDRKTGRRWYRVPLVAEILADSAEAAYKAVGASVEARNRANPDHPLRITVGPENEVEGWRDEEQGA